MIPEDAYLIIIGSMKSGTTSLFNYLERHPAICGSHIKEPCYFSQRPHRGERVDLNEYGKLWPDYDPGQHRYCMEASTEYTRAPGFGFVAKEIHQSGLRPKLVYLMRHPVKRIESHLNFTGEWDLNNYPIDVSRYYFQLEHYRERFPREDLKLLLFEDLQADPEGVVNGLLEWLGLSPLSAPGVGEQHNPTRTMTKMEWFARKLGLGGLAHALPKPVQKLIIRSLETVSNPEHRKLTEDEIQEIRAALQDDMTKLQGEYGIDVSRWGF